MNGLRLAKRLSYAAENGFSGTGVLTLPACPADCGTAVLLIHGGGWSSMSSAGMAGVAEFLNRLGLAVFNIEYRLAGDAVYPAAVLDCRKAAEFLLTANIPELADCRREQCWVVGASAGGYLALATALALGKKRVCGCIAVSAIGDPAPDCARHPDRYDVWLGRRATGDDLDALGRVMRDWDRRAPKLFWTHCLDDEVVPPESMLNFDEAARQRGAEVESYTYRRRPGLSGHAIWVPESSPHRLIAELESAIAGFIQATPVFFKRPQN